MRALFISDIHLTNTLIDNDALLESLYEKFDDAHINKLDLISISGDFFDKAILFAHPDIVAIQNFIIFLLRQVKQFNIVLRVLEGTPSHDAKQSKSFDYLNTALDINADCKHVNNLSIEHHDGLNIDMLFIPDEWRATTEATQQDVNKLLKEHNLLQVDFTIMHGMVEWQVPKGLHLPSHSSKFYSGITRKYVSIGHFHNMEVRENIIAQGSFDRLAHNEEEPKGHIVVDVEGEYYGNNDKLTFVENKKATLFKTIDIRGLSIDAADEALEVVKTYPYKSHVRILKDKVSPLEGLIEAIRQKYPSLHWKIKTESISKPVQIIKPVHKAIVINKKEITALLLDRLKVSNIESILINKAEEILSEVI